MTTEVPVRTESDRLLTEARELVRRREPQARLKRALWAAGLIGLNLLGWGLFLAWLHPN